MLEGNYPLGFRTRLHRKDLGIALAAARDLGVIIPNNNANGDARISWQDGTGNLAVITLINVDQASLSSEDFFFDF